MAAMTALQWVDFIFEKARIVAHDAIKRGKHQEIGLTVEIRGGQPHEARMPDGERLRPAKA